MTNLEVLQRIEQTPGNARIEKLIWIAAQLEDDSQIKEFMEELPVQFYMNYMPEIYNSNYFSDYHDNPIEGIVNFEYYGFLAEVFLPKLSDFSFGDGNNPTSWRSSPGYCSIEYVYAESLPVLISTIEKIARDKFYKEAQAAYNSIHKKDAPIN